MPKLLTDNFQKQLNKHKHPWYCMEIHNSDHSEILEKYLDEVKEKVSSGESSIPSILETEYKINPFLRCDNEFIKDRINDKFGETNSEIEIFTALRKWKDNF